MARKKSRKATKGKRKNQSRKSKGTVFGDLDKLGKDLDKNFNKIADDAGDSIFGVADSFGKFAGT